MITVRAATQVIEHFRDLARILRVPNNRVRVIAPYVGGGFGGKEDMTVEPFLALVVQHTRRPVSMVWSRSESLLAREKRHPMKLRYRTACDADGRLVAQDVVILADGGAYALLSALVLLYATTCSQGPYACPNVRVDARVDPLIVRALVAVLQPIENLLATTGLLGAHAGLEAPDEILGFVNIILLSLEVLEL